MRIVMFCLLTTVPVFAQSTRPILQPAGHSLVSYENRAQVSVELRILSGVGFIRPANAASQLLTPPERLSTAKLATVSDAELDASRGIQLTSATEAVETRNPVFAKTLDDAATRRLMERVQGDARANILMAPKLTVFAGQEAQIRDTVSRPLVTGMDGTNDRPHVESVDEGLNFVVRCDVCPDRRVRLDLRATLSEIKDVVTLMTSESEGTVVQIPTVRKSEVELSALLRSGETLMVQGLQRTQDARTPRTPLSRVLYLSRVLPQPDTEAKIVPVVLLVTPRILDVSHGAD